LTSWIIETVCGASTAGGAPQPLHALDLFPENDFFSDVV
jgi:hypothetical protein